jgi:nucleoside-diphosphate-sugar epimerase
MTVHLTGADGYLGWPATFRLVRGGTGRTVAVDVEDVAADTTTAGETIGFETKSPVETTVRGRVR